MPAPPATAAPLANSHRPKPESFAAGGGSARGEWVDPLTQTLVPDDETDDRSNGFAFRTIDLPDGAAGDASARNDGRVKDDGGGKNDGGAPDPAAGLPVRVVRPDADGAAVDYRLGVVIGEGGAGVIRESVQTALGRTVALKRLRAGKGGRDAGDPRSGKSRSGEARSGDGRDRGDDPTVSPQTQSPERARRRFLTEARVVARLDHPNILPVHELAVDQDGEPFLAMKRVRGVPWSEKLAAGDRVADVHANLEILRRVCDATAFAHARGVLHRDLKPENVLLGEFGEVLVTDWGLAAPADDVPCCEGPTGTPAYMAPEQARADTAATDERTDVYLLGGTLLRIVTGRHPHAGATLTECLAEAAAGTLPADDTPADGPPVEGATELTTVARRALAVDPADRYPSVAQFHAALRDVGTHVDSVRMASRGRALAAEAAAVPDGETPYDRYGLAVATLREAVRTWPGNTCAAHSLRETQAAFAASACDHDDLDLAESLVEAADLADHPVAARCRELRAAHRQQADERVELERGVAKWSRAFLTSPDLVFLVDLRDGRVRDVNEVFCARLGLRADDVIGETVDGLGFWPPGPLRDAFVAALKERGGFENADTRFLTAAGDEVPVLVSAKVTDLGGEPLVITNARDVADRVAHERALRASEERLRRTQRLAGLGTWEFDVKTGGTTWSDETFRIAGLSPGDRAPDFDEYLDTVHPDDRPELLAKIDRAVKHGEPYELRVRHRRPDGTWNDVLGRGEPEREADEPDGKVVRLFGSVLDLSGQAG